jgi:hypothetical protein
MSHPPFWSSHSASTTTALAGASAGGGRLGRRRKGTGWPFGRPGYYPTPACPRSRAAGDSRTPVRQMWQP